jgi:hypothetical protein
LPSFLSSGLLRPHDFPGSPATSSANELPLGEEYEEEDMTDNLEEWSPTVRFLIVI